MKKIILIIGSEDTVFSLSHAIRKGGFSKELFFVGGNLDTKSMGTNIEIPRFGKDTVSDNKEILEICKAQCIDIVLFAPENPSDRGFSEYLKETSELSKKVDVIGPIHPPLNEGAVASWYNIKYCEALEKVSTLIK